MVKKQLDNILFVRFFIFLTHQQFIERVTHITLNKEQILKFDRLKEELDSIVLDHAITYQAYMFFPQDNFVNDHHCLLLVGANFSMSLDEFQKLDEGYQIPIIVQPYDMYVKAQLDKKIDTLSQTVDKLHKKQAELPTNQFITQQLNESGGGQQQNLDMCFMYSMPVSCDTPIENYTPYAHFKEQVSRIRCTMEVDPLLEIGGGTMQLKPIVATKNSLRECLSVWKPRILHISCYSRANGSLFFENDEKGKFGQLDLLTCADLDRILKECFGNIPQLIYLNTTFPDKAAQVFRKYGAQHVVMLRSFLAQVDTVGKQFTENFYLNLFKRGNNVVTAFESARVNIRYKYDIKACQCFFPESRSNCPSSTPDKLELEALIIHKIYHVPSEECTCRNRDLSIHDNKCIWDTKVKNTCTTSFKTCFLHNSELAKQPLSISRIEILPREFLEAEDNPAESCQCFYPKKNSYCAEEEKYQIDEGKKSQGLCGRAADFLKLINQIKQKPDKVHLVTGKAGSGRTCFVKKAAFFLLQRRIIDAKFYIDFEDVKDSSIFQDRFKLATKFHFEKEKSAEQQNKAVAHPIVFLDNIDKLVKTKWFVEWMDALRDRVPTLIVLVVGEESASSEVNHSNWQIYTLNELAFEDSLQFLYSRVELYLDCKMVKFQDFGVMLKNEKGILLPKKMEAYILSLQELSREDQKEKKDKRLRKLKKKKVQESLSKKQNQEQVSSKMMQNLRVSSESMHRFLLLFTAFDSRFTNLQWESVLELLSVSLDFSQGSLLTIHQFIQEEQKMYQISKYNQNTFQEEQEFQSQYLEEIDGSFMVKHQVKKIILSENDYNFNSQREFVRFVHSLLLFYFQHYNESSTDHQELLKYSSIFKDFALGQIAFKAKIYESMKQVENLMNVVQQTMQAPYFLQICKIDWKSQLKQTNPKDCSFAEVLLDTLILIPAVLNILKNKKKSLVSLENSLEKFQLIFQTLMAQQSGMDLTIRQQKAQKYYLQIKLYRISEQSILSPNLLESDPQVLRQIQRLEWEFQSAIQYIKLYHSWIRVNENKALTGPESENIVALLKRVKIQLKQDQLFRKKRELMAALLFMKYFEISQIGVKQKQIEDRSLALEFEIYAAQCGKYFKEDSCLALIAQLAQSKIIKATCFKEKKLELARLNMEIRKKIQSIKEKQKHFYFSKELNALIYSFINDSKSLPSEFSFFSARPLRKAGKPNQLNIATYNNHFETNVTKILQGFGIDIYARFQVLIPRNFLKIMENSNNQYLILRAHTFQVSERLYFIMQDAQLEETYLEITPAFLRLFRIVQVQWLLIIGMDSEMAEKRIQAIISKEQNCPFISWVDYPEEQYQKLSPERMEDLISIQICEIQIWLRGILFSEQPSLEMERLKKEKKMNFVRQKMTVENSCSFGNVVGKYHSLSMKDEKRRVLKVQLTPISANRLRVLAESMSFFSHRKKILNIYGQDANQLDRYVSCLMFLLFERGMFSNGMFKIDCQYVAAKGNPCLRDYLLRIESNVGKAISQKYPVEKVLLILKSFDKINLKYNSLFLTTLLKKNVSLLVMTEKSIGEALKKQQTSRQLYQEFDQQFQDVNM